MRLTSNLWMRRGFLFAVLIVLASSGAIGSLASAAEPAKVFILSGQLAALLELQNQPALPVLRGAAGEDQVVILFAADPQRAAELPGELFSTDPVEYCGGGVTCCDSTKGVMVVNATYDGQDGWVQTGELCEPPNAVTVDFATVPEEVSIELKKSFGVDYCFLETVDAEGNSRVLVNGPWDDCFEEEDQSDVEGARPTRVRAAAQDGALWLASFVTPRTMFRATSPIILAADCPSQKPAACPGTETSTKLCASADDYWYKKVDQNKWCKMSRCTGC